MRFKLDENLPTELSSLLKDGGHDSSTVAEQGLMGAADSVLIQHCCSQKLAFVTLDTDFANIRTYPPAEFSGIVVLRLTRQDRPHVLGVMSRFIPSLKGEPLEGRLWIVEDDRTRVRR